MNNIYRQILNRRFTAVDFDELTLDSIAKLTNTIIKLWRCMKRKMLPTPAKFHCILMRDLSRVFQEVLLTPKESITKGGLCAKEGNLSNFIQENMLRGLWKYEYDPVFCDKLTNDKDKNAYESFVKNIVKEEFKEEQNNKLNCDFVEFNIRITDLENCLQHTLLISRLKTYLPFQIPLSFCTNFKIFCNRNHLKLILIPSLISCYKTMDLN